MTNIIFALLILSQFSPMPKLDSKLSWRTLESEHFAVHFSDQYDWQSQQEFAQEIIAYCEDAHARLALFMRWQPKQKTNVVVGDFYDYVSAWATQFPHNTIFICPTFDKDMRVNYSDWLRQLIIHEYTHILNMDMSYGIPRFFRRIFGRIIVPNTVIPLFMQEGFSVSNETRFTSLGRSSSSYYQMLMRSKILADRFFPVDKCVTYDLAQYPSGETPYFYGSQFYDYLASKYGDTVLTKYSNWLSGGLPLFYNTQAKRVFGKNLYSLWQDFKAQSYQEYAQQIQIIRENPVTQANQMTQTGFNTQSPVFSPDNQKIYYLARTNNDYPGLYELDLATAKNIKLLSKNISSNIRISSDGATLIFSVRDYYQNNYRFDDLYAYSLAGKKLTRLTHGLRASDADFSRIDSNIVFVRNQNGQTDLCLMKLATKEIIPLSHREDFTQYSNPRFAPDGKKIAVAIWKKGGAQDIYIYDLATEWLVPITEDYYLDIEPSWSQDGEYLLFSSDRNKVFNIYAYHFKTDKLYQVTNVVTGAFSPELASDNHKLLFQSHSDQGYDIYLAQINLDSLAQHALVEMRASDTLADIKYDIFPTTVSTSLYYYNPFPSILPKFWLPMVMYEHREKWSYGALTYGADALFQHQYLLQAFYNPQTKKPNIYFNYTLDKFKSTILFNAEYEYQRLQGSIASRFSFLKNDYQHYLTGSYLFDYKYNLDNGLGLFYQFNSSKFYPYSISPEQGRYLGFKGKIFKKDLLSKSDKSGLSLVFAEYINLPIKNHILMLNANIGFTFDGYFFTMGRSNASFVIRGASQSNSAHNGISFITEYRFPLVWIERGFGTLPIFFRNISGKVFFDTGRLFEGLNITNSSYPTLKGGGIEISLQTLCFFQVPVNFTLGIASNLSDKLISQYYFKIYHSIPFFDNFVKISDFDI